MAGKDSEIKIKNGNGNSNSANTTNNSNNVGYSYTSSQFNAALEDENKVLKEALNSLRDEVEKLRAPSLMVADVSDVLENHRALIKIPN